jgi:hypothetical protein
MGGSWRMIFVWEDLPFPAPIMHPFGTIKIEETPMVRLRLAALAVVAGLGLGCGCLSLSQFPLLERLRCRSSADCCDNGAIPDGTGPIVEGPVTNGVPPSGPGIAPIPSVTPQNGMPPLASPPRIAPQPQAQPAPYTP